ncbi:tyrosine-type recombinase/integrase [Bradyrhizobium sp. 138]|uniref:tyrosine-type recombinase/integrase n=1 Tax=Bradyrhizobium sp. 138 TaxID=2782615 RepID=UPI001FFAA2F9|nr:site-specific integrase [Bradyrhizobium sp. 138]MCK1732947.1 tyrosine-type recombinase/integrase [Bradyrhizobium sp. 138]
MAKPLTAAAVRKLRPSNVRREIPDGACPGLHLIVQPTGTKSWALRYRRPDKRPAKLVLGSVYDVDVVDCEEPPVIGGHLTLAGARRIVAELRHQLAQGRDPAAAHFAQRDLARSAREQHAKHTFEIAARDFIEEYAAKKTRRWKEQARLLGLLPKDLSLIANGLAYRWAKRPIIEIDGNDIFSVIDETRRSGAPGLARRSQGPTESRARAMLSVLSMMFSWLAQQRRVSMNPCTEVHRPGTPKPRDRVLSDAEIIKFWYACESEQISFSAPLKLLLITGCRLNEVAGMRLSELSDDLSTWVIPGIRTKNGLPHTVPIPQLATDILRDALPRTARNDFAFSTTGYSPVSGWSKVKGRLDRHMKVPDWRLHDLRRTAATAMAELGIAPHIVEAALNHVSGAKAGVAGTYNRAQYSAEKKDALRQWAEHLVALVYSERDNVVTLSMRGR